MNTIPTTTSLYTGIKSALEAGLDITIADTRNFENELSKMEAGTLKLLYYEIAGLQGNLFPDTAISEQFGGTLERAGRIFLGRNPFPATQGQYTIFVTGTIGATIPASTTWKSDDSSLSPGQLFILDAAHVMAATTDSITVTAIIGGLASRLNVADTLTCTQPLLHVNGGAVVNTETVVPIDAEDLELYRSKILEKILLVAGSWSATDYRLIGVNVSGVGQIYAYAFTFHSNEVNVWIEGTIPGTTTGGGVITAVSTATELVRPLGVFIVHYAACPINSIDITIAEPVPGTITSDQQALILSGLRTAINEIRPFIAGSDNPANFQITDRFNAPELYRSVLNIVSVPISSITFTVDSTPATSYLADNGNIPYLTSITYA